MKIQDVSDILADCPLDFISQCISSGGTARALVVPNVADRSRKFFDGLDKFVRRHGAGGMAWVAFPPVATSRDPLQEARAGSTRSVACLAELRGKIQPF